MKTTIFSILRWGERTRSLPAIARRRREPSLASGERGRPDRTPIGVPPKGATH